MPAAQQVGPGRGLTDRDAQFMPGAAGLGDEPVEFIQACPGQHPAGGGVEQPSGAVRQYRRAIGAGAKAQAAMAAVVQDDLAVRRRVAARECRLAAAPGSKPGERELDVLPGAEIIGCEVQAGAQVVTRRAAANGDAIAPAAVGVDDAKLRKHRCLFCIHQVLQLEALLAADDWRRSPRCQSSAVIACGLRWRDRRGSACS